ncbi:hypothetical protein CTAYLR_006652 [Chrysophaeum taylorii]|uniref:Glutamyl-tRNA reductase n=1 Tax=Chrysophaeum taylorii TaxID=2483200 RepID=A0AAD7XIP1_9STRA|nr:hypothetical protein CTAYLR_006652 [Chrysophaeum taylorii]
MSASAFTTTTPVVVGRVQQLAAVAIPRTEESAAVKVRDVSPLPLSKAPKLADVSLPLDRAVADEEDDEAKRARRLAAAEKPLDVFVVGLSHHNAEVETREKLAIPEAEWQEAARDIVKSSDGAVEEAAVLSTCNRFEVYFAARDARAGFAATSKYLQSRSGLPMSTLRESLFMLSYEHATAHALRVAAGLDSLVVGEGQILAQMKQCYAHAIEGSGGKVTTRLLNAAVASGKRARDETDIAKGAVSISSAAYELAAQRAMDDLGKPLDRAEVLVFGAGKMTRLLLTHMAAHGLRKCVLINRSEPRARAMADEFKESHGLEIEVVATGGDASLAMSRVEDADLVFTSTSSESYVLTPKDLEARQTPLMLVDISVPRNVDPACDDLENVAAYDVDSLKAVVARNTAKRRREIVAAERLLEEDAADFRGWIATLGAVPAITQLQRKAEELRVAEMKRANAKLKHLSQREIEAVERLSRGIVSKLLHGPMSALRDSKEAKAQRSPLGLVRKMFQL